MAKPDTYGHHAETLTLETYRDSAFVERRALTGGLVTAAWFLFPAMTPPVRWDAVVTGDGVAEWAIDAERVADIANGEWVELWYNGVCWKKGTVLRRGDLPA